MRSRKLQEELSYFIPAERFESLAVREGRHNDVPGGAVRAEIFMVRNVPTEALTVTEGSLLMVEVNKISEVEHRLTPSARFALDRAFRRGERDDVAHQ